MNCSFVILGIKPLSYLIALGDVILYFKHHLLIDGYSLLMPYTKLEILFNLLLS